MDWDSCSRKNTADSDYSDSFFNVFFAVCERRILQIFQRLYYAAYDHAGKNKRGQLGDSIFSLMHPLDVLYFIDTFILIGLAVFYNRPSETTTKRPFKIVMGTSILVFLVNLAVAEIDRPELLTRSFDRNYLVKYLGTYNFTIYDAVQNIKSNSQRALASSSDVTEVENYIKANHDKPNAEYFGKAKGMNVVYISLESLQTFAIDYKIDGKEVTPFLNSLAHDNETFYFDNFFHQTGQGKTSDAEFMMDNSLYPLSQGSVFINKAQNTLQSAPAILKSQGYTSAAFHGNYKTFWNRNEMYKAIGYDKFFDATYYDMSEDKTKNYGLKDKPFFEESMPLLKSLKQPFYTKFITLSNHFPFEMDEGDTDFPAGDTGDSVVDHYFQSANYMDQAIEQFFNDLKKPDCMIIRLSSCTGTTTEFQKITTKRWPKYWAKTSHHMKTPNCKRYRCSSMRLGSRESNPINTAAKSM